MYRDHYQSELSFLRELGKEFAAANPSSAHFFGAQGGGDPDVERLLEGFAFLSAQIRRRAEDAVPELSESLLELMLPHYLRATPACSIVQMEPKPGLLRHVHTVPKGTPIGADEVEGSSCTFQTCEDLALMPLRMGEATLDERRAQYPCIRLQLRWKEVERDAVCAFGRIQWFLSGSYALSSALLVWFARYLESVDIVGADGEAFGRASLRVSTLGSHGLPAGQVSARTPETTLGTPGPGLRDALNGQSMQTSPLWPWDRSLHDAPRLLQEYFALPSRGLFVTLHGLDRLNASQIPEDPILQFRFRAPPALPESLPKDAFRLHCVSVVNLFETSAEPIALDHGRSEYFLRPAGVAPRHAEVFSVGRVTGLRAHRQGRISYSPFSSYLHTLDPHVRDDRGQSQHFFALRRQFSPVDDSVDTYIRFRHPVDSSPSLAEETVSIDLTCTNRWLPSSLRLGSISKPIQGSPTVATFRNITAVSKPLPPPLGRELHWRLVSHLARSQDAIASAQALRSMLGLYNFQATIDVQQGRANALRAASVRRVDALPSYRIWKGMPVRGVDVQVELDEDAFSSVGDAYLMGCALDALLADRVAINTFTALVVTLHPSGEELRWAPRAGKQALL